MSSTNPNPIRLRIAPSPTGPLHLGLARTALYNFLFAQKYQGKFILRIEDTDLERSEKKWERDIMEGLLWLGIKWDEGPVAIAQIKNLKLKIKNYLGDYGPYRQSERTEIYTKYLKQLLSENKAYYCYCAPQELAQEKKERLKKGKPPGYKGRCRKLTQKMTRQYQREGRRPIIRFKVEPEMIGWSDLVRGWIEFETSLLGDFSIAKDLITPLYNFAVVIDDETMKISHVIRGEDHISNTPKQILLQKALHFATPDDSQTSERTIKYGHLPLILGPDRQKLSKRHGATSITEYRRKGYLPEALINFMAFLGWNPGTEEEIFSFSKLIKKFSLNQVQKAGAIFTLERLNWLNGYYIREMERGELVQRCLPYLEKTGYLKGVESFQNKRGGFSKYQTQTGEIFDFEHLKRIISLIQERLKRLDETAKFLGFIFKDTLEYNSEILIPKGEDKKTTVRALINARKKLKLLKVKNFKRNQIKENLEWVCQKKGFTHQQILWPLRVAITGLEASPGVFEVMEVLGKEKTLKRIKEGSRRLIKSKVKC